MSQDAFTMYKLASQGYCCSQILILMDLMDKGIENHDLIRAMAGLCVGTGGSGKTCGIVTGGACLMGIYAGKGTPEETRSYNLNRMIMEYIEVNGSITNEKTRELCGFTKQQARSALDKMRGEALIQLVGAGRSSKYMKSSETR